MLLARRGFTLMELVIALLVLSLLALIAIPTYNAVKENSLERVVTVTGQALARNANAMAVSGASTGAITTQALVWDAAGETYGFDPMTTASPWASTDDSESATLDPALSTGPGGSIGLTITQRWAYLCKAIDVVAKPGTAAVWADPSTVRDCDTGNATPPPPAPTPLTVRYATTTLTPTADACPTITGPDGSTVTYALDAALTAELAAAGVTFSPTTGCFTLTSAGSLPDAYTATAGFDYVVPFTSSRPVVNCGLTSAQRVKCWGGGGYGTQPVPYADGLPDQDITALDSDSGLMCALTSAGTVWCWTNNGAASIASGVSDAVAISVGQGTMCALTRSGDVYCGASTATKLTGFGPGSTVGPVRALAASSSTNVCAIDTVGAVWCAGTDAAHRLGQGNFFDTPSVTTPVPVALPGTAKALAVADDTVCALLHSGRVSCWGDNDFGQTGTGARTDTVAWPSPVRTDPGTVLAGVTSIDGAASTFCATVGTGTVTCWGDVSNGAGGVGDTTATGNIASYAGTYAWDGADGGVMTDAVSVEVHPQAYGGQGVCAVRRDASVWCWDADNRSGQLGDGTTTGKAYPVRVLTTGTAVLDTQVTVTATAHLVDASTQTATSAPFTLRTESIPPPPTTATPTAVTLSNRFIDDYSSVAYVTATRTGTGTLTYATNKTAAELAAADYVFDPTTGQFTPRHRYDRYTQVAVNGEHHSSYISDNAQMNSVCGLTEAGVVKCWGLDGTLRPSGTNTVEDTPKFVPDLGGTVLDIAGGDNVTCARTTLGQLGCWGQVDATGAVETAYNSGAQSVLHDEDVVMVPTEAGGLLSNVIAWGPVGPAGCAVVGADMTATSGTVHCWGNNYSGQLGRATASGTSTQMYTAAEATAVTAAMGPAIAVSGSCALDTAGATWCWGASSPTGAVTVSKTANPAGATQLAGDCAVVSGRVYCGSTSPLTRADGSVVTGVSDIARSGATTLCVVANGDVLCKGPDRAGVLGNGTTSLTTSSNSGAGVTALSPVWASPDGSATLTGATGAAILAAGGTPHDGTVGQGGGCAVRTDGSIWCWGMLNNKYFLGDGTATGRAYAAPAKQTGPYPTLADVTVTVTGGATSKTSAAFTITDGTATSSPATFTPGAGAAPANDLRANAVALTASTPVTVSTATATSTTATDPAGSHATVWYSFTAPSAGSVTLDFTTSGWDGHLYVLAADGTVLADNDDADGTWATSRISRFAMTSGQSVYVVAAGGTDTARGTGTLTAAFTPRNGDDDFATAPTLSDSTVYAIDTRLATSTTETDPAGTSSTVWYSYTPTSNGYLDASVVTAGWDATVYVTTSTRTVLASSTTGSPSPVVSMVPVTAGQVTYVLVSGKTVADRGIATLELTMHPAPNGDQLGDNAPLVVNTPVTVDTTYASNTAATDAFAGSSTSTAARTLWYAYTAPEGGYLTATLTTDGRTGPELWVRNAANTSTLASDTATGTTQAVIGRVPLTSGQTYLLLVTSDSAARYGPAVLDVQFHPYPANDERVNAQTIPLLTSASDIATVDTTWASANAADPASVSGTPNQWYAFTATTTGRVTLDLAATGWGTRVFIYNAALSSVAGSNSTTGTRQLTYLVSAPGTYYVSVGGNASTDRGTGTLTTTWEPSPANDFITGALPIGGGTGLLSPTETLTSTFNSTLATTVNSSGGTTGSGDWSTSIYNSLWYTFTVPASSAHGYYTLSASTPGWNSRLYARNPANTANFGSSTGTSSTPSFTDNSYPANTATCRPGETCYVVVYGATATDKGAGTITATWTPVLGEVAADAITVTPVAGTPVATAVNNTNYLDEVAKTNTGANQTYRKGVWLKVTPTTSGAMSVSFARGAGWTAALAIQGIYTDPAGTAVAYATGGAPNVSIPVAAGTTYYILIGSGSINAGYYGAGTVTVTAP